MTRLKKKNLFMSFFLILFSLIVAFSLNLINFNITNDSTMHVLNSMIHFQFIFLGLFHLIVCLLMFKRNDFKYFLLMALISYCIYLTYFLSLDNGFIYLFILLGYLLKIIISFYIKNINKIFLDIKKIMITDSVCFCLFIYFSLNFSRDIGSLFLLGSLLFDFYNIYLLVKNKYKNGFKHSLLFFCGSTVLLYSFIVNHKDLGRYFEGILIFILILNYFIFGLTLYKLNELKKNYYEKEKLSQDILIMSNMLVATTKEKENLQTSILLNQIRPHFLYNVLNTISALCSIDPEKAEQMTVSFGKYLRSNMSSLNQQEIIPFENEIEHVKNYVNLELIRFNAVEEKISVIYDLSETNFYLPPLTIQPIVENAIKHGLREKEGIGILKISSYVEDNFYCISIEDDGVGFDPENSFSDKSIGLENSRKRLHNVVKGSLEIKSRVGFGTKTVIKIIKDRFY